MPLSIVLFYVLWDRYSFWEEDITKVYKHREGNANPQVYGPQLSGEYNFYNVGHNDNSLYKVATHAKPQY